MKLCFVLLIVALIGQYSLFFHHATSRFQLLFRKGDILNIHEIEHDKLDWSLFFFFFFNENISGSSSQIPHSLTRMSCCCEHTISVD